VADTQFSPLGTGAAPQDWTLPGSLELTLVGAQAIFDGTAAGASFLPALQIISDSGKSVGIYITDTAATAGSIAEVSFFPFSGAAASGGGSGNTTTTFQGHYGSAGSTALGANATGALQWSHTGGDAVLDLTVNTAPTAVHTGLHIISISVDNDETGTAVAGNYFDTNLVLGTAGQTVSRSPEASAANLRVYSTVPGVGSLTAGDTVSMSVTARSAADVFAIVTADVSVINVV
jgi:hypothetical protein